MKLTGKIALITGASRGIGYEVAKNFIEEGAHVIAAARTVGGLEELDDYAKTLGSSITIVPIDLQKFNLIDQLGYAIYQKFGKLDILIGNAGILGESAPVGHISVDTWQKVMDINLTANWRLLRSCDPLLRKSPKANVIFTSSNKVSDNPAYFSAYTASKAGLEALAKTYENEVKKTNIKVNIVTLEPVDTALRAKYMTGENKKLIKKPKEVSRVFIDLISL
jgi:NAD(P)-dependent dehydrogenase (short-subunit alcohol dehydrogenase family)